MKKLIMFVLTGMMVFSLAACSSTEIKDEGSKIISGPDNGIELEQATILSDTVQILIPKQFQEMSEEFAKEKYPNGNRPPFIVTNKEGTVDIALNQTDNPSSEEQMTEYLNDLKSTLEKVSPSATWFASEVIEINGRKVGKLEFLAPAGEANVYNLMFFTDVNGKLLIGTMNSTEELMGEWQPIANEILNSLTIK